MYSLRTLPENRVTPVTLAPAQFHDYIDCFNRGDFPGFTRYYAEDVWFQGRGRNLRGRRAIEDYYRKVREHLRESVNFVVYTVAGGRFIHSRSARFEPAP